MGPFHIGEPPQFISMAVHIRCVGAVAQHSVNDGSYLCPGDRIYGRNVPSKNPPIQLSIPREIAHLNRSN